MAKQKTQRGSAAKRREQQRQNRMKTTQSQTTKRAGRKRATAKRSPWLLVGGTIVLIAVIIGFFIFLSNQSSSKTIGQNRTPVDATTLKQVTNVDPALLAQIGTGGVQNPFIVPSGSPPLLTGAHGKPEVFFFGAEWCPLCAAERWSVIVALSHFGTFQNLKEIASSSSDSYPNTSTFSFFQSSYTSSFIDFVSVENQDTQRNNLQTPTASEQQILTQYNVTGYPFMDFGNRYLITAASYDPAVLRTNPSDPSSDPLTQQQIASQLSTENTISKNILGVANYMTAAICKITNGQPGNVCNAAPFPSIEQSLNSTPVGMNGMQLGLVPNGVEVTGRKQD
jgi:hypothetical protein